MAIVRTGVRATEDEIEDAKARALAMRETPVARVAGRWLHQDAQEAFTRWIDELAQRHGLPSPQTVDGVVFHYGMSQEGEFTRWVP